MPLEIDLSDECASISFEKYIATIDSRRYDFEDYGDLIDSARFLKQLSNNRTFLLTKLFEELKTLVAFQRTNYYGPQVFILHATEKYFVRANIWRPLSEVEKSISGFRYDICHDHNFDILTVGHFGPGYRARCYTYDRRQVSGLLSERVAIATDGLFALHPGRVALYRAKHDVHIQLPPDDLSVSLNLIPNNRKLRDQQFQFDETSGRICRYLQASGSELVIRLAGVLGDESCLDVLTEIATGNPSPQLRALANVARLQIDNKADISADPSALVRDIIAKEMRSYGACLRLYND